MKSVLALDTCSHHASAAVVTSSGCAARVMMETGKPSRTLLPAMQEMLRAESLDPGALDAFAVTIGPGSFTGVRVGMAAMQALAISLDKPIVGIPTLEAIAANGREHPGPLCVLADARRGRVYAAVYDIEAGGWPVELTAAADVDPVAFLQALPGPVTVLGDGLGAHPHARASLPEGCTLPESDPWLAPVVGELALHRLSAHTLSRAGDLRPLYIRSADAKLPAATRTVADD